MPELMGRFFCLKVIILLCLTVFLGNYSVIKKNTRIQWGTKSSICNVLWIRGLQIPWFDRSNLFLRRISNPSGRLMGVWDGWRGWNFQGTKKVVES